MATIRTAIMVHDNMTKAFRSMSSAMNIVISSFESMERASSNAIDTASIQAARRELNQAEIAFNEIEQEINEASDAQQRFNNDVRNGQSAAEGLGRKIKAVVGAYLGIQGLKKGAGIVNDWLNSANILNAAETQLSTVMANMGGAQDEYEAIKARAARIESQSTFGTETLIAGAGELATYLESGKAIETMMGSLADYAAGMGGIHADSRQMVEYATQLGKALDGQFDGLRKKGFDVSDAQKAIIENGTEMERVAVVSDIISQSWDGLAQRLANTPQGQIVQLANTIDGIKQKIGNALYPTVMELFNKINANLPQIETLMQGFGMAAMFVIDVLSYLITVAGDVSTFIIDNWSWIAPIILGIAGALAIYNAMLVIQAAVTWIADGAAKAFFRTLLANPLFWIALAIGAIIAIIYKWVQSVGGIKIAWMIATHFISTAISGLKITFFVVVYGILNLMDKLSIGMRAGSIGIQNIMGDMKSNVLTVLQNMVNGAIDIINEFIGALNKIDFVSIELVQNVTFGTAAAIENEAKKQAREAELMDYRSEIEKRITERDAAIEKMKKDAASEFKKRDAEIKAAQKAAEANQKNKNDYAVTFEPNPNGSGFGDFDKHGAETAKNTAKMAKSMSGTVDELKYLRDLAEREAINRFTTAEIKVDMTNNNNINNELDIDGIIDRFGEKVEETLDKLAEGAVYDV